MKKGGVKSAATEKTGLQRHTITHVTILWSQTHRRVILPLYVGTEDWWLQLQACTRGLFYLSQGTR